MRHKLNIHFFQHVPFETPAYIAHWAKEKNHKLTYTLFYENDILPDLNEIDWLVIMGGPMNVYEIEKYPWLVKEKEYIKNAIDSNKVVIGICLGAQLIADVLGARIYRNHSKEIGWFSVNLTTEGKSNDLFNCLPENFFAFHWHGETFTLPSNAIHIAESKACRNQLFSFGRSVFGFQFHFEMTNEAILAMLKDGKEELQKGEFVQSSDEIKNKVKLITETNELMKKFLDRLEAGL